MNKKQRKKLEDKKKIETRSKVQTQKAIRDFQQNKMSFISYNLDQQDQASSYLSGLKNFPK
jgi:hypothetical protein